MIKVLIVDDTNLVCRGLGEMLKSESDIEVVGFAHNGIQAMETIVSKNPDIILLDLVMPEMGGIETTKQIKQQFPKLKVIILSGSDDEPSILKAIAAGAQGYLLKNINTDDLARAIRAASHGFVELAPGIINNLAKVAAQRVEPKKKIPVEVDDRVLPEKNQNQVKTIEPKKKLSVNFIVGIIGLILISQISWLETYLAHLGLFLLITAMATRSFKEQKSLLILTLVIIFGHAIEATCYIWQTNIADILFTSSHYRWGIIFGIISLLTIIFRVFRQKANEKWQEIYLYLFGLLALSIAVLHTILIGSKYLGLFEIDFGDRVRTYMLGFAVLFIVFWLPKPTFKSLLAFKGKKLVSK